MSLNKAQQAQWNVITGLFSTISRLSADPEVVNKEMESWITAFETDCQGKITVIIKLGEKPEIYYLDSSKDSLKIVRDAVPSTVLRAKVFGVTLSSTIQYKESYTHSNDLLATALRTLADKIESLPLELSAQNESMDIMELLSGKVSPEGDQDDQGDQGDQNPAADTTDAEAASEELSATPEADASLEHSDAQSEEDENEDGKLVIQLIPGEIE